jgi:hypothetical protein
VLAGLAPPVFVLALVLVPIEFVLEPARELVLMLEFMFVLVPVVFVLVPVSVAVFMLECPAMPPVLVLSVLVFVTVAVLVALVFVVSVVAQPIKNKEAASKVKTVIVRFIEFSFPS